jgi:SAM-dependent methyltransferase
MGMRIDNLSPAIGTVVATGWEPSGLSDAEIWDGEAYHRALYRNGDTNRPVKWHKNSVDKLIEIASPHIDNGSLVVDYGSGTGGSAIELLKSLDERGVEVELVLIDPLVSWFSKARDLLGEREDVHFELSIEREASGRTSFRRLEDILEGRKADVIISSSTLHLIPAKTIGDLALQFAGSLKEDGAFVWDSGDLESDLRPESSALLHDPYRAVRELLRLDEIRSARLSEMADDEKDGHERRLDRIFPSPLSIDVVLGALREAGFSSEIQDKVVSFSREDAENFVLVPRLAEIASPLHLGEERDDAIRGALDSALRSIADEGRGNDEEYRSHWVFGRHWLNQRT